MSRPQTPSFWSGAVRQRGTATDASMQNAYLKDTLGVVSNRTAVRRLIFGAVLGVVEGGKRGEEKQRR